MIYRLTTDLLCQLLVVAVAVLALEIVVDTRGDASQTEARQHPPAEELLHRRLPVEPRAAGPSVEPPGLVPKPWILYKK